MRNRCRHKNTEILDCVELERYKWYKNCGVYKKETLNENGVAWCWTDWKSPRSATNSLWMKNI